MKTTPDLNPIPAVSGKPSELSTDPKNSDVLPVGEMSSQMLHDHLGFPVPEQQAVYDATNERVAKAKARFYGKNSVIAPVDWDKLSPQGKQHRQKVGNAINPQETGARANVSRLDSLLSKVALLHKPGRRQVLPFDEAQEVVRAIYENDLANRERMPYWTDESFSVVDEVTKYFIGDPTSLIPLSKCLYVYGAVGVGKTYLFRVMQILCSIVPITDMQFSQVSTKRLLRAISDAKSLKPLTRIEQGSWLIDDLGAEKKTVKVYAESQDPIDELLSSCYDAYIERGRLTHFTSNKQPDELETIYATRNYDRLCEMVESVFFPGESIRIDPNQLDDEALSTPD